MHLHLLLDRRLWSHHHLLAVHLSGLLLLLNWYNILNDWSHSFVMLEIGTCATDLVLRLGSILNGLLLVVITNVPGKVRGLHSAELLGTLGSGLGLFSLFILLLLLLLRVHLGCVATILPAIVHEGKEDTEY